MLAVWSPKVTKFWHDAYIQCFHLFIVSQPTCMYNNSALDKLILANSDLNWSTWTTSLHDSLNKDIDILTWTLNIIVPRSLSNIYVKFMNTHKMCWVICQLFIFTVQLSYFISLCFIKEVCSIQHKLYSILWGHQPLESM